MIDLKWVNSEPEFQYRIGDAILYGESRPGLDARSRILENPDRFRGSIACRYLEEIGRNNPCIEVSSLREVVSKCAQSDSFDRPDPDEAVVHLRLGDGKATPIAIEDMSVALSRCMELWGKRPSKMTLVSAFHIGRSILTPENKASHETKFHDQTTLAENLQRSLGDRLEMPCKIRSSADPDSDFFYLASARFLVLGSGGFSLAASLASTASICIPPWCLFSDGRKGNLMPIEKYYELMSPRRPHVL